MKRKLTLAFFTSILAIILFLIATLYNDNYKRTLNPVLFHLKNFQKTEQLSGKVLQVETTQFNPNTYFSAFVESHVYYKIYLEQNEKITSIISIGKKPCPYINIIHNHRSIIKTESIEKFFGYRVTEDHINNLANQINRLENNRKISKFKLQQLSELKKEKSFLEESESEIFYLFDSKDWMKK